MQTRTKKILLLLPLVLIAPLGIYILWLWLTAPSSEVRVIGVEFKVHTVFYGHEKVPEKTIIIIPPTGGINILDKLYAHSLWKAGCDVYILTDWTGYGEIAYDLKVHERFYGSNRTAIGLIIEEIKSPFIGVLGTSVGGLHTAVSMGTHERLSSALVITAGAPITEVVINSDQEAMKLLKSKRYELFNFKDDAEYLNILNDALTIDSFDLPRKFEGKKLGVIIAEKDTTVPTANQHKLKEFWNAEVILSLPLNHFDGIVRTAIFHREKVVEFFTTP